MLFVGIVRGALSFSIITIVQRRGQFVRVMAPLSRNRNEPFLGWGTRAKDRTTRARNAAKEFLSAISVLSALVGLGA